MMGLLRCGSGNLFLFVLLLLFRIILSHAKDQHIGQIYPGFSASQLEWIDHNGFFLLSKNSAFALGFFIPLDVSLVVLVITHLSSNKVVWAANGDVGLLIRNTDRFVFDHSGNAYLEGKNNGTVWSTNTTGQKVRSMELLDSGNLVLHSGENGRTVPVWQSFSYPTDTLLEGQAFVEGMRLKSFHSHMNLTHYLGYVAGDLVLYAGFETPQVYWSLSEEAQSSKNATATTGGKVKVLIESV